MKNPAVRAPYRKAIGDTGDKQLVLLWVQPRVPIVINYGTSNDTSSITATPYGENSAVAVGTGAETENGYEHTVTLVAGTAVVTLAFPNDQRANIFLAAEDNPSTNEKKRLAGTLLNLQLCWQVIATIQQAGLDKATGIVADVSKIRRILSLVTSDAKFKPTRVRRIDLTMLCVRLVAEIVERAGAAELVPNLNRLNTWADGGHWSSIRESSAVCQPLSHRQIRLAISGALMLAT